MPGTGQEGLLFGRKAAKDVCSLACTLAGSGTPKSKSFLVLFFKKEHFLLAYRSNGYDGAAYWKLLCGSGGEGRTETGLDQVCVGGERSTVFFKKTKNFCHFAYVARLTSHTKMAKAF
jgi:hypothetical protein